MTMNGISVNVAMKACLGKQTRREQGKVWKLEY